MLKSSSICLRGFHCLVGVGLVCAAHAQEQAGGGVAPVSFAGDSVLRVDVPDQTKLDLVLSLTDDVWSHHVVDGKLDVLVTPQQRARIDDAGIDYTVFIEDVQLAIEAERTSSLRGQSFFDSYHTYEEVEAFLDDTVAAFPDLAEKVDFGRSLEGRTMWGIRITGEPTPGFKPAVLYHGGQHAREWITVAMTTFLIDHLLSNYGNDPEVTDLVDRVEWFILPIMNPDGYVYSWTSNRMWRKNRRMNDDGTEGVDLNRNWAVGWGLDEGSSGEGFAETYRGAAPFSEPETIAMGQFIIAHDNLRAYCDIHSYSELILWPWGYQPELTPIDDEYRDVANVMGSRIEAIHGHFYSRGPIYTEIYPVSGGSSDWVYGDQGIFAYGFELRDRGQHGFLLPADQIVSASEEIVPALMYLTDWAAPHLVIELPNGPPQASPGSQALAFPVEIQASSELPMPETAQIRYRFGDSGGFTSADLSHQSGTLYDAELPLSCETLGQFYIRATSESGTEVRLPRGAPSQIFEVVNPTPLSVEGGATDVWKCVGSSVNLSFSVTGSEPLSYQWQMNGVDISGADSATLMIDPIGTSDFATYRLEISDLCDNVVMSEEINLHEAEVSIVQQPQDLTFCEGMSPSFDVSTTPTEGVTYQWYHDGVAIPGATGSRLQLFEVDYPAAGEYHCEVASDCVRESSEFAILTIPFVQLTSEPMSQCATTGDEVIFSVSGSGEDLLVQWQKDQVNLPGETSIDLIIDSASAADAGAYRAVVFTPELCMDVSREALLLVDACTTCGSSLAGDLDGDGDRDLLDYATFQVCFAPSLPTASGCSCSDINGDDVVDEIDFDLFGHAIDGP